MAGWKLVTEGRVTDSFKDLSGHTVLPNFVLKMKIIGLCRNMPLSYFPPSLFLALCKRQMLVPEGDRLTALKTSSLLLSYSTQGALAEQLKAQKHLSQDVFLQRENANLIFLYETPWCISGELMTKRSKILCLLTKSQSSQQSNKKKYLLQIYFSHPLAYLFI